MNEQVKKAKAVGRVFAKSELDAYKEDQCRKLRERGFEEQREFNVQAVEDARVSASMAPISIGSTATGSGARAAPTRRFGGPV